MPQEIIGQIFSVLGMILTVISFQFKTKKQILLIQTIGSSFFLISYILFGSWAGVYLNVVFLVRNIIFSFGVDKKWAQNRAWLIVILIAVVIAGALGYSSYWDILPIVGSVFGTVAAYVKNENRFRLLKLGDSPCWLIYNCSVPSIGGIICEIFNILSIVLGLIRYRKNFVNK